MQTRRVMGLILTTALTGAPWAAMATTGPHCAILPTQIVKTGQGRGTGAFGEMALPTPVLPPGNSPHAPLSAATLATAAGQGRPEIADSAQPSSSTPTPQAPAVPAPIPTAPEQHPPATVPVGAASTASHRFEGPATLPLKPIEKAAIAASPVLTRLASHGAELYALGTQHGMRGVFARNGRYFQVFYVTPDGKAAVAGVMWNAAGRNVTLRQVRRVPDLVPQVKIGDVGSRPVTRHVAYRVGSASTGKAAPTGQPAPVPLPGGLPKGTLFQALAMSDHGTIGKAGAPRVWMLMDPLCSYSIAAMHRLMPEVAAGKLRVSVVPLSILDYEDHGMSTPEAKIMLSQPARRMAADWIDRGLAGERASPGASAKLAYNMSLARAIDLKGTPTLLWHETNGGVGRSNGLPSHLTAFTASIRKPS
ncbi:hypothetical protein [Acidiphilium acidophilum]|uniref:hypothetical protein n=1 Tax=Acidiphilium acidophilum TaxID=76588 RepID=UPI002E8E6586|nr:hypothetical protein [Acidiphilium acidophilum]